MAYIDFDNPHTATGRITIISGNLCLKRDDDTISSVPLIEKKEMLFSGLKELGYSEKSIENIKWMVNVIVEEGERSIGTYNSLFKKYNKGSRRRVELIECLMFDFFDELPTPSRFFPEADYYKLSRDYQRLVDDCIVAGRSHKNDSTLRVEAAILSTFLCYLQDCKVTSICQLTETTIREYMIYGKVEPPILTRIGNFLWDYFHSIGDEEGKFVCGLFPRKAANRKVYSAITKEEEETLEAYLLDESSQLTKRDRAVGILMFYTGIRAGECRNMKMGDIKWSQDYIRVFQSKTNKEINLPLRPVVGNAIWDYINNERPNCKSDLLFVTDKPFTNASVAIYPYVIINEIFEKAGIRKGDVRKGTHLLRHNLADRMIDAGSELSVIQSTLGHSQIDTTAGYITANINQLRACALSLERYPIKHVLFNTDLRDENKN